jgi:hypothetical protein
VQILLSSRRVHHLRVVRTRVVVVVVSHIAELSFLSLSGFRFDAKRSVRNMSEKVI